MFLSRLILNPYCRRVQEDLRSPYEMHRTIMRAFYADDADQPGRVLFRVDELEDYLGHPQTVLLVQSDKQPDWSRLADGPGTAEYAITIESKTIDPRPATAQRLRFRLRANPTVKREGKRYGLFRQEQQTAWLTRKGEQGGFRLVDCRAVQPALVHERIGSNGSKADASFLSVTFEGTLEVADADKFCSTLQSGIGSGKGFGFGLLSISSAR